MRILIATDEKETLGKANTFFDDSIELVLAANRLSAKERFLSEHFDLVFYDYSFLKMPGLEHKDFFEQLLNEKPTSKFIFLNKAEDLHESVKLLKDGAKNYLTFPIDPLEIRLVAEKEITASRRESELESLRNHFWDKESIEIVKTSNSKMLEVYQMIENVAPTSSTVLLTGETGVGKSLMARMIHQHSTRRDKQFIHVHCGAIPDGLIESELFGHEKGAFTNAIKRKLGKFELANNGTIFLDEISTLTPAAQIKLLQVMQDSLFQRVGGETDIKVNVRIIAATNDSLKGMTEDGSFRKDLYYRLNVFPIEIPPLRDRKEDIPTIAQSILNKLKKKNTKQVKGFQEEALSALQNYSWPGNIREFENILERAYILEKTANLTPQVFPMEFFEENPDQTVMPLNLELTLAEARNRSVELFEKQYLLEVLTQTQGKIGPAAAQAGISTRQLNNLMNKHDITKGRFKLNN